MGSDALSLSVINSSLNRTSGLGTSGLGDRVDQRSEREAARRRDREVGSRDFGVRDLVSNSSERREARKRVNVDFSRASGIRAGDVRRLDSREARARISLPGTRQGGKCVWIKLWVANSRSGREESQDSSGRRGKEGPGSATEPPEEAGSSARV